MRILVYLRRLQVRNAANPQTGTEIQRWKARGTPLPLISACLCVFAASLQAESSVPQNIQWNMAVPLEFEVIV